jgi:hypothetical protein
MFKTVVPPGRILTLFRHLDESEPGQAIPSVGMNATPKDSEETFSRD